MKKYLLFSLLSLTLAGAAHAEMKVGTINYQKVIQEYAKMKEHRQKMQEEGAKLESQRRDKLDELNKMGAEIRKLQEEANDKSLSEKVREEKTIAAKKKYEELQVADRTASQAYNATMQDLRGTDQRKLAEVMDDIKSAVQKYGAEQKYDLIVDAGQQNTSQTTTFNQILAYSSPQVKDVSDDITKALNQGKTAAVTAPAPAPTPAPAKKP
jgi:Skp family chaperone for outer membrane proteins